MSVRKDLDLSFLLKTDFMLISFFAEVNFVEESIFFITYVSSVSMARLGGKFVRWISF